MPGLRLCLLQQEALLHTLARKAVTSPGKCPLESGDIEAVGSRH